MINPGESTLKQTRTPQNSKAAGKSIRRILLWLPASLFIAVFFFYPLARILWLGLNPASLRTLDQSSFVLTSHVLFFTFYQASLSTLLTLILGLPAAYLFARYDFYGKSLLRALTAVPFMLPTVVVAAGFSALLGARGWLNLGLMRLLGLDSPPIVFIGSLAAILLAHVFYNTTIVIRVVGNALARLDPRLDQAARTLGANSIKTFWTISLPLLRPYLLAAGLLVFLFDFSSYGVILLLGGPGYATLEVEIYNQALRQLNIPLATLLSFVQLLCTLLFSILYSVVMARSTVQTSPRPVNNHLRRARTWREKVFVGVMVTVSIALFILPMASLPLRSVTRLEAARGERAAVHVGLTTEFYRELFINRRDSIFYVPPIQAAVNSLAYAGLTAAAALLLGFPMAAALTRPGRLERLIDPFLMLPLGASAVTLGLGFILTFNQRPLSLLTSPLIVPLAHTIIALPFVIRSLQPALASIPSRLKQAAATLGASPFRNWLAVDWPIVFRATLASAIFAFTISLGEFGATSLVSRPQYPTIPMAIYGFLSQPGGLNYGQAMAMASLLMALTTASILLIERLRLPGAGEF